MKLNRYEVALLVGPFTLITTALLYYFTPAINLWNLPFYAIVLLAATGTALTGVVSIALAQDFFPRLSIDDDANMTKAIVTLAGTAFFATLLASMSAMIPGGGDRLGQVFGTPEQVKEQKLPDLDINNAPLIPEHLAARKAQAALSTLGPSTSQLKLGKLQKQEVNGKLVWVSFLQPSGLFQWFSLDSTPGYVVVSASDYSDAQVITQIKGQSLALRYNEGGFFSEQIERHIWLNGYMTKKLTTPRPEIDDEGNPYYVTTIIENQVGTHGPKATGVLVTNPQTGEIKEYSVEQAPAWVDIIQNEGLVLEQIDLAGDFVNGRFNFSKKDKFEVSSMDQVFAKNGVSYWVAGITNVASKTGVQRFIFVNTRTKQSFSYVVNGVLEERAQQIVLDSHTKQYEASNAIPFMVNNRPTYVMSLSLGDAIYAYGMVDIESETVFSSKQTLEATLRDYLNARSNSGLNADENAKPQEYAGRVFRIGQDAKSGIYKIRIEGIPVVFLAAPEISHDLAMTGEGDLVQAQGVSFREDEVNLTTYTNKTILGN